MISYDLTNCPYLPLTTVLSFIVDNRGRTVPTSESGIPLIATNCIRNESLYPKFDKIRYISEDTYNSWFRAHPIPGDIIFVNKGAPGRVCLVPDPVEFCIAQDMMAFRVNKEIINNKYLFAVLRSPQFQTQIEQFHVGTLIPHFKKGDLNKLLIPIPSMIIQEFIGETYFALCSKIENNNKINDNLEKMAQAIFKSYYCQVIKVVPFTSVVQVLGGGTPKTGNADFWNGSIPFFTPKDAGSPYVLTTEKNITESGLHNCSSKLYPVNTTFVTARGTVGKVSLAGVPMAMNQSCYALLPHSGVSLLLAHHMTLEIVNSLKHKASGAVFDAIVTRDFEMESVGVLEDKHAAEFEKIVTPIYDAILLNYIQNMKLINLRDNILPRLMTGEIDVSEVNF